MLVRRLGGHGVIAWVKAIDDVLAVNLFHLAGFVLRTTRDRDRLWLRITRDRDVDGPLDQRHRELQVARLVRLDTETLGCSSVVVAGFNLHGVFAGVQFARVKPAVCVGRILGVFLTVLGDEDGGVGDGCGEVVEKRAAHRVERLHQDFAAAVFAGLQRDFAAAFAVGLAFGCFGRIGSGQDVLDRSHAFRVGIHRASGDIKFGVGDGVAGVVDNLQDEVHLVQHERKVVRFGAILFHLRSLRRRRIPLRAINLDGVGARW